MHYTGMAAIQMPATIRYEPGVFAVSVIVTVCLATLALWLLFRGLTTSASAKHWRRGASATVMGISVTAMHYTGMSAAYFLPADRAIISTTSLDC